MRSALLFAGFSLAATSCGVTAIENHSKDAAAPTDRREYVMRTVDFSHYAGKLACQTACTLPLYKQPERAYLPSGKDVSLTKVVNSPLPDQSAPNAIWPHGASVASNLRILPSKVKVVCQVVGSEYIAPNTTQPAVFDVIEVDDRLQPTGQNGAHINAQAQGEMRTETAVFGFERHGQQVTAFAFALARWLGGEERITELNACTSRQDPQGNPSIG